MLYLRTGLMRTRPRFSLSGFLFVRFCSLCFGFVLVCEFWLSPESQNKIKVKKTRNGEGRPEGKMKTGTTYSTVNSIS